LAPAYDKIMPEPPKISFKLMPTILRLPRIARSLAKSAAMPRGVISSPQSSHYPKSQQQLDTW
jgi:hypothetical protein